MTEPVFPSPSLLRVTAERHATARDHDYSERVLRRGHENDGRWQPETCATSPLGENLGLHRRGSCASGRRRSYCVAASLLARDLTAPTEPPIEAASHAPPSRGGQARRTRPLLLRTSKSTRAQDLGFRVGGHASAGVTPRPPPARTRVPPAREARRVAMTTSDSSGPSIASRWLDEMHRLERNGHMTHAAGQLRA